MNKHLIILLTTLTIAACQQNSKESEQKRPNVLFIAVDDLRPMLGSYGKSFIKTPHIDRLAAHGTLFERAYCNIPVCGASRASILTGLRPTRSRFLGYDSRAENDAPGVVSLPAHFKNNGYYTASLGKVFHFPDDLAQSSWSEKPWRAQIFRNNRVIKGRDYQLKPNQDLQDRPGKRGSSYENADVPDSAYFDGKMTKRAIAKLRAFGETDTPFFLAIGYLKPHLPFNAPQKYWDMYPKETINLVENDFWPEDAPREGFYGTGELRKYHGVPKEGAIPDTLALKLKRGYQACVSYTDALIGEVLNTLEETGLDDNTIIVLWGDHGYLLGEHRLWCKHITFNKALQVPLVISAPGYTGDQRTSQLAEFVDVYPTLCELAGFKIPDHLMGKSLVPQLENPQAKGKEYVVSRYGNMEAIKTDKYLYTEWIDSVGNVTDRMLYDHIKDPEENVNISERSEYVEVVQELSEKLAKLNESLN
ncbi:MAG: sulfatase [Cyclobacteriaceae bacterium]|nr:sulfatase [Cyclobacteriaceae bacterium HetDA_MAG_MS6]